MFIPQWEGSIEAYSKKYIQRNMWKFYYMGYERDDILHEAVIVFCDCRDKYVNKVTEPAHFMALFKTSIHNRFLEIASESIAKKEFEVFNEEDEYTLDRVIDEESTIAIMLKQAPKEVKDVLSLALNAPKELLESIGFMKKRNRSFLNNAKLCRLLGKDPKSINLIRMTEEYFGRSL